MKISALTPDGRNANKGTARGRKVVRESLRKYGAGRSILLDRNGHIIAGNKTVEGATALGMEDVQVVKSDGSKLIAVQRTDLDINDKKARELAIADNRAGELGLQWDEDVLKQFEAEEIDLTPFWDERELVQFFARTGEDAPEPKIDQAAELQAKWGTKLGQLWLIGPHRLFCGDSTNKEAVARLWANVAQPEPKIMVTDPPYGVDYARIVAGRENQKAGGWDEIENDALTDEQLLALLKQSFGLCSAPVAFVWHPAGRRRFLFWQALESNGWRIAQEIIWVKNAMVFGRADYQWRHEPCLYGKRKGAGRQEDRTQTTVWEFNKPHNSQHPTQKPVELFAQAIRNHTVRGDICYDPFAGSGTLLAACVIDGRRGFGIELEPNYVAVALERMTEMGLTPKLLDA